MQRKDLRREIRLEEERAKTEAQEARKRQKTELTRSEAQHAVSVFVADKVVEGSTQNFVTGHVLFTAWKRERRGIIQKKDFNEALLTCFGTDNFKSLHAFRTETGQKTTTTFVFMGLRCKTL